MGLSLNKRHSGRQIFISVTYNNGHSGRLSMKVDETGGSNMAQYRAEVPGRRVTMLSLRLNCFLHTLDYLYQEFDL